MDRELAHADARLERLLGLRARLVDPDADLGARFVAGLVARGIATEAGARLALAHLEPYPTQDERAQLLHSVPAAARCHVVLSANVSVAAYRAIALGLACAPVVMIKPSRRDPVLADLLIEALTNDGGTTVVARVSAIDAKDGDHVMAYGSDATLEAIAAALPAGATLDRHGTGFGVAMVSPTDDPHAAGERIAYDVVAFDQRGCLSPRVVFVAGDVAHTRAVAGAVARSLARLAGEVPALPLTPTDQRELATYLRLVEAAAETVGDGDVRLGLDLEPRALPLPPPVRIVHVVHADGARAAELLGSMARYVTVVGASDPSAEGLAQALPHARIAALGAMQRPRLDGPVDRRPALVRGRASG